MNRKRLIIPFALSALVIAVLALIPAFAVVQDKNAEPFIGSFKGTAKIGTGEIEMPLTLELKSVDGKISGHAMAANTDYKVESVKVTDGSLTLNLGAGGEAPTLRLKSNGDKLVGDWVNGTQKGTVELKKIDPNAKDEISGEWDAIADASGQPFPFALTLKVEGDKVTGSSVSQLGNSNISEGSWKDGKLAVILEGGSGKIALAATMVDGKLSGEYDYAGQLQGKWVAIRKK